MKVILDENLPRPINDRARFCEIRDACLSDPDEASSHILSDPSLLNVRSGIGETVMHWLVVEDVIPAVRSLLALGAAVDSTNDFGQTPLMEAASLGYVEMCELLLGHGADPRYISPNDESPLCHAARSHQLETLQVLLARFADDEDLQPYFGDVYLGIIFSADSPVASVLESRGLSARRLSADE